MPGTLGRLEGSGAPLWLWAAAEYWMPAEDGLLWWESLEQSKESPTLHSDQNKTYDKLYVMWGTSFGNVIIVVYKFLRTYFRMLPELWPISSSPAVFQRADAGLAPQ